MRRRTKGELLVENGQLKGEIARLTSEKRDADRLRTEGRIEAFEFAANQFEVYADDNDTIHQRYRTKGKELDIAKKRSQTFRDAAEDLRRYAEEQKKDLPQ